MGLTASIDMRSPSLVGGVMLSRQLMPTPLPDERMHSSSCSVENYERWRTMPYDPARWGSTGCGNCWSDRFAGAKSAGHPRCGHERQGLDVGHDCRGVVGRRVPNGPVHVAAPRADRTAHDDRRPAVRGRGICGAGRFAAAGRRGPRSPRGPGPIGPHVLRNHDGHGLAALSAAEGSGRRAGSRLGRTARCDQCLPAGGLGHHQHQLRPYAAIGKHPGGDRGGEGGHHQAGRAGGQRSRRSRKPAT